MKTIDVADAAASLPAYAQKGLKECVVVTQRGKPVFALMPLTEDDWKIWSSAAIRDSARS